MTAQMIVTETRVILSDDATREDLQRACAEYPGKSVVKANSLRLAAAPEDNKAMADMQTRLRKLETLVAGLLAEKQMQVTRPVVTASEEKEEAPMVARKPRAEKPATVAVIPAPKPTPKAAATEAKPRRKLSELSMDELRQRVEKRGGNIARILKGKHARARNKALVAWLVANKKQAAQASA